MPRRTIPFIIIAAFIALTSLAYVAFNREDVALDDAFRKTKGYAYARLADGITHYQLLQAKKTNAKTSYVVLVHGTTIPMYEYDMLAPALAEAGFHVLRYDHYGRGYSSRPDVAYDRALYTRQLAELLTNVVGTNACHLVGHSFGAPVAVRFAVTVPDRVRRVILFGPMIDSVVGDGGIKAARIPLLGTLLARFAVVPVTASRAEALFRDVTNRPPSYYNARYREQTRIKGFERALLSLFRGSALRDDRGTYAEYGALEKETLVIWGKEDANISRTMIDEILARVPHARLITYPATGHSPNLSHPSRFAQDVAAFLAE